MRAEVRSNCLKTVQTLLKFQAKTYHHSVRVLNMSPFLHPLFLQRIFPPIYLYRTSALRHGTGSERVWASEAFTVERSSRSFILLFISRIVRYFLAFLHAAAARWAAWYWKKKWCLGLGVSNRSAAQINIHALCSVPHSPRNSNNLIFSAFFLFAYVICVTYWMRTRGIIIKKWISSSVRTSKLLKCVWRNKYRPLSQIDK